MEYTRACRAANLWPAVIADLIGGYAEYTLEELLDRAIGAQNPGKTVLSAGKAKFHAFWSWYPEGQKMVVWSKYGMYILPKDRLIESMTTLRWWRENDLYGSMQPYEVEGVNAIIADILKGGTGILE